MCGVVVDYCAVAGDYHVYHVWVFDFLLNSQKLPLIEADGERCDDD